MKVCVNCFNDEEIKSFIISNSTDNGNCDSCNHNSKTKLIDINELLDFFAEFIDIFEEDELGSSLTKITQDDWNIFVNEDVAINILSNVLTLLGKTQINSTSLVNYSTEIRECVSYWDTLKDVLKWEKRFLTNLNEIRDFGWDRLFSTVATWSPANKLYRARIHHTEGSDKYSIEKMGQPEREKVSDGRANPVGIPYLYLSKSVKTTLYETRASFLDELSIGEFEVKNSSKLILVDFTEVLSSYKNIESIKGHTKSVLLKTRISDSLSKPIRRYDSTLEYIPTQFICEYIRYITNADGIIFNSSLDKNGQNIVLFEQNKVECTAVEKHKVIRIDIESKTI